MGSFPRDPEEDWNARFIHHRTWYPHRRILGLRFLPMHVACSKRLAAPGRRSRPFDSRGRLLTNCYVP
ncbi:hypothetical protein ABTY61_08285 [Kitasatospora sp. NPDC096128]|uniref:hypothetical protein n=1 Tax=Kitasatospora sp. NPDC096128 TaxID=3155547 RepID=UPI00331CB8A9